MMNCNILHFAVLCFFNSIHGLDDRFENAITPSLRVAALQKISSSELKSDNYKEFKNTTLRGNYFSKLTLSEYEEVTKPMNADVTPENDNFVLSTTITNIHEENLTAYFNSTSKNDEYKRILRKPRSVTQQYRRLKQIKRSRSKYRSHGDRDEFWEPSLNDPGPYRRIYRGRKTKIQNYPFLVTVHVLGRFVCGGSIIKSDLVITAASCLKRWQEWKNNQSELNETDTTTTTGAFFSMTDDDTTGSETGSTESSVTEIDKNASNETKSNVSIVNGTASTSNKTSSSKNASNQTTTDETATNITTTDETSANGTVAEETITTETTKPTEPKPTSCAGFWCYYPVTVIYRTMPSYNTPDNYTTLHKALRWKERLITYIPTHSPKPKPKHHALAVRVGTSYYRLEGKVVKVVDVHFHPEYDPEDLDNNLAILRLERHLNLTRRSVKKIRISKDQNVTEDTVVTIVGWGAKTYQNKVYNALWNVIHKANLVVTSRDECENYSFYSYYVNENNFCAHSNTTDHQGACDSDMGDPGVVGYRLVGVTSFVPPRCGVPDTPTVFLNVGYYAEWIQEFIGNDSSSSREVFTKFNPSSTISPDNEKSNCTVLLGEYYNCTALGGENSNCTTLAIENMNCTILPVENATCTILPGGESNCTTLPVKNSDLTTLTEETTTAQLTTNASILRDHDFQLPADGDFLPELKGRYQGQWVNPEDNEY